MNQKWFGFLSFVWIISMFLGSIYERHGAVEAGQNYSTGTATFTQNSEIVIGSGTVWVEAMVGGTIKYEADNRTYMIEAVTNSTNLTLTRYYAYSGGSGDYIMLLTPAWFGKTGESTLEYLADIRHITYREGEVGPLAWVTPNPEYFQTMWQVVTWDFTFLRGEGFEMIRWIVLVPFTTAIVFGLMYSFIQLMMGFIRR